MPNQWLSSPFLKSLIYDSLPPCGQAALESRILNFLAYNHYHLPMYARPGTMWNRANPGWQIKMMLIISPRDQVHNLPKILCTTLVSCNYIHLYKHWKSFADRLSPRRYSGKTKGERIAIRYELLTQIIRHTVFQLKVKRRAPDCSLGLRRTLWGWPSLRHDTSARQSSAIGGETERHEICS